MTTTALDRPGFPSSPSPRWRAALLGFSLTLLLAVLVLAGASLGVGIGNDSKVMPHVSVAGVELGGLDRAAAGERLTTSLPSLSSGSLTVRVDGTPTSISYERLGRAYDTDAMLDAAFGVARDGSPVADGVARLRALLHATALPVAVHAYDDAALDAFVAETGASVARDPVDATVSLDDGAFVVSPGRASTARQAGCRAGNIRGGRCAAERVDRHHPGHGQHGRRPGRRRGGAPGCSAQAEAQR